MRRADLGRRKQIPLRIEPELGQVREDGSEAAPNKSGDVLQEDEARSHLANDASDVGPEPPLVGGAAALAGGGEWLAGEARSDAIHDAAPRAAVEGSEIRPNRRVIQGFVRHARSQDRAGIGFVLNEADDASSWDRQPEAEVESPDSGAETKHSEGR